MKVNYQKVKNRFISIFGAFCVFVSFLLVPVSAAGANGNEFVFKDYVDYTFSDNDTVVNAIASFPDSWIRTNAHRYSGANSFYLGTFTGPNVSFSTKFQERDTLSLEMLPFGGNAYTGHDVGFQFQNTRVLDIRYVPSETVVKFGFSVTISAERVINTPSTTVMLYFVDSDGKVVYKYTDGFFAGISKLDNIVICHYYYSLNLDSLPIPDNAIGFVPYMLLGNFEVDFDSIEIEYIPFEFSYSMSALQYESASNQQLQDSIDDVEKALEELATGTPEQNDQAQNAVNDLNGTADKLGDLGDTMSSVEKPVIDSSQISAGSLVPETSLTVLAMPFQALWENDVLLAILTIVVTLVLVSWVFFGKKG